MNTPFISVIVPLYNTEKYIDEALQSLLHQTYKIDQIIVIDDGSTDKGAEIVKKYPQIELYQQENQGLKKTLNIGLSKATGDYIGFLDADDRWKLDKLEIQLNHLQNNPSLDMVFGRSTRFKMILDEKGEEQEELLDYVKAVYLSGGLYRKTVFERIGRFSTDSKLHNFIDWFGRVKDAKLSILEIENVICERRIHGNNMGIVNKDKQREEYFATLKAALDRKRSLNNQ
jgi:glycosyltransferase involved in cell wall biosynthesis